MRAVGTSDRPHCQPIRAQSCRDSVPSRSRWRSSHPPPGPHASGGEDLHPIGFGPSGKSPRRAGTLPAGRPRIVAERRPEGLADGLPQTLGAFGIAARRIEAGEGRARGTAGSPPSAPTIAARNRCGGRASQHVGHFDRRRAAVVLLEHAAMAGEPYFAMSRPSGGSSRSSARNGPRGDLAQRGRVTSSTHSPPRSRRPGPPAAPSRPRDAAACRGLRG